MTREYKRQKISGLDTKTYVLFDAVDASWKITISSSEVKLEGITISDYDDLQFFAKLTSDAWKERQKLIPKIVAPSEDVTMATLKENPLPEWMRLK